MEGSPFVSLRGLAAALLRLLIENRAQKAAELSRNHLLCLLPWSRSLAFIISCVPKELLTAWHVWHKILFPWYFITRERHEDCGSKFFDSSNLRLNTEFKFEMLVYASSRPEACLKQQHIYSCSRSNWSMENSEIKCAVAALYDGLIQSAGCNGPHLLRSFR